ncbi:MAG: DUF4118 domain-containing protein [Aristaeellaceae bacterium]
MEMQGRAADRNRGQLKIFFGYAPGVGKTCAMLQAAQDARRRGVDVVCGWVDDHGRPGTRSRVGALERLPMMRLPNGAGEFDLDAALRRRPRLILLDELNHVNAPICRHSRRYQDVEELLNAGIDVYATVNVQHIESLNDQVAAITGAPERERIPDEVFDRADQVELVDVEPEDLLERMRAERGDVNWTLETLRALREIALRRCADRVNLLTGEKNARFHTDEHVLVCLSSAPSNARIIRTAARMAAAFHGGFTALYVETPDFAAMSEADRDRLRANMRLARQLGATIETVCGDDIPYQIAEFARLSGVSKIVLGRSAAAHKRLIPKPSLTDQLIARAPSMDIYIIPDSTSDADYRPRRSRGPLATFSPWDILKSFVVLLGATALSVVFYELGFSEANIIMAYILGVLITSLVTTHPGYSIISSIASVVIFNYLFTEPRYTLHAYDAGYPVTFAIMFLAAYITGTLTVRLKNHARQSAEAAYRTKILFDTDQLLNRARDREEIASALADQIVKLLNRDVAIYLCEGGELGAPRLFAAQPETLREDMTGDDAREVAQWVLRNNKHAGATTDTFSGARCLYLAIRVNQNVYGVVGIAIDGEPLGSFEYSVLLSMLGEGALALENEKNAREKEAAAILAKNEQLRANLLRSISHDLRTPLTSISGNASNLLTSADDFDEATKRQLYADIYDDSMWLINLVENLLSVTRIEEGRMNLNPSAELMDEVIAEALRHINRKSVEHEISVHSSEDFLLAHMDARLIVQVVINIVDNAIKYTPAGSHIRIETEKAGAWVVVRIADDGPGISDEAKAQVFDMFYSGANRVADSRRSLGLGLFLCKSIVTAHGGTISVRDNQPHGTIFEFTLPAEEVQLHE